MIINSTLDIKIQNNIVNSVKNNLRKIDDKIQVSVVVMDYNGAVRGLLGVGIGIKVNLIERLNLKDSWVQFLKHMYI